MPVWCRRPWALSERQRHLRCRRGGRDEVGVLKGDAGLAALGFGVPLDVSPFVSVVDRDHVVAYLAF